MMFKLMIILALIAMLRGCSAAPAGQDVEPSLPPQTASAGVAAAGKALPAADATLSLGPVGVGAVGLEEPVAITGCR